jgi:hypothetical protein
MSKSIVNQDFGAAGRTGDGFRRVGGLAQPLWRQPASTTRWSHVLE